MVAVLIVQGEGEKERRLIVKYRFTVYIMYQRSVVTQERNIKGKGERAQSTLL